MSWDYKLSEQALNQLKKLDNQAASQILCYLDKRVVGTHNPRQWGKQLEQYLAIPQR